MKKFLTIAGIAATCVAFADSETVTGTTEVGMLEITSTAKNCIVAVPYLELTGGNICVSNIVKTANLEPGDELYVFGGTRGSWTAWVLSSNETTKAKYWQSVGTCSIKDGKPVAGTSPSPSDTTMVVGSAIWLTRKNPTSDPFYVYGGYANDLKTTIAANTMTLVANPTANPVNIASVFTNPATGDKIWTLGEDGAATTQYIYGTKGGETGWFFRSGYKEASAPTLPAGCGVWMQLKHNATIEW